MPHDPDKTGPLAVPMSTDEAVRDLYRWKEETIEPWRKRAEDWVGGQKEGDLPQIRSRLDGAEEKVDNFKAEFARLNTKIDTSTGTLFKKLATMESVVNVLQSQNRDQKRIAHAVLVAAIIGAGAMIANAVLNYNHNVRTQQEIQHVR